MWSAWRFSDLGRFSFHEWIWVETMRAAKYLEELLDTD